MTGHLQMSFSHSDVSLGSDTVEKLSKELVQEPINQRAHSTPMCIPTHNPFPVSQKALDDNFVTAELLWALF